LIATTIAISIKNFPYQLLILLIKNQVKPKPTDVEISIVFSSIAAVVVLVLLQKS